ncbi:unnamed protein product [Acanthoscelides obtectus]|uniref:Uncharacterized protein n=1 Tax=Acanthoscelides obtectus TaxID=200917 RepID=A0A9P0NQJ1_ACAOB|nr:unnamed protein product [Acanthoscelides obtectus]CAK1657990.1 hypothetical protein AOBTE_LOCUS20640 [Acanthoscelides obtectus]
MSIQKRCSRDRMVDACKLERNSPETKLWWERLFALMEGDAAIKPERNIHVLRQVLPREVLARIIRILEYDHQQYTPEEPIEKEDEDELLEINVKRKKSLSTVTDASVFNSTIKLTVKDKDKEELIDPKNPYVKFFKRPPHRAAIWRELPPLSWKEMNLNQKSDALAVKIASDFVNWAKHTFKESPVSIKNVIEMFEIATQMQSAKSLCVRMKEMPSIPNDIAEYHGLPQRGRTNMLHREIRRDQKAANRKPRYMAFGRRLPTDMQVRPGNKVASDQWMRCQNVPERLESMAAVWQGITHLKSTRAFCVYMYEAHPDVAPPQYLLDIGMMHLNREPSINSNSEENRTEGSL